jgi:hypothetical protein
VDSANTVYVTDTGNHTIRVLTPAGVSSTLAGLAGSFGSSDGTNASARFNAPAGIAVDGSGNLYVTDYNNDTIRKVTPAGMVTTLAGWPGMWGSTDGPGSSALFFGPSGISVDGSGNLYVVDSGNSTLRKLTYAGGSWTVSTVAGSPGISGSLDGTGTGAEFYYPVGATVSAAGYVYLADAGNNTIRSQAIPPSILTQPQSQTNQTGALTLLSVSVYGSMPLTYTWQYNGTNLPGNTSGSSLVTSSAGSYQVIVSNVAGQITSAVATLTLTNSSTQGQAGVFQGIAMLPNGAMHFSLSGTTDATYTLYVSTNLVNWAPLRTFSMTNGAVELTDLTATNLPAQFYRLVSP